MIQKIGLKSELFNKVISGQKVATTRLGIKDCHLGRCFFYDHNEKIESVLVEINQIKKVRYRDILYDTKLPILEGYRSRLDFLSALEDIYGDIDPDQEMTVIFFETTR